MTMLRRSFMSEPHHLFKCVEWIVRAENGCPHYPYQNQDEEYQLPVVLADYASHERRLPAQIRGAGIKLLGDDHVVEARDEEGDLVEIRCAGNLHTPRDLAAFAEEQRGVVIGAEDEVAGDLLLDENPGIRKGR